MKSKVVKIIMNAVLLMVVLTTLQEVMCQNITTTTGGSNAIGPTVGVMGHRSESTVEDAILLEAVGGMPGVLISKQMDKLAAKLKANLKGARVVRVGEGITITFDSSPLFKHDSFELQATRNMKNLAKALKIYNYTNAIVEGHTDSTGEELYNQSLSDKRASEVKKYLVQHDVKDPRIITKGYGESQPVATNDTEPGKQANRRVEIAIYANDDMKYLARKGELTEYIASKK